MMVQMLEKYVDVSGGKIYTLSFGLGPEDLLVIHGGPDWDHTYLRSAGELLSAERRVIFLDIRGCGKSTRFGSPEHYKIDFVVQDIISILNAYAIKHFSILGFSFGGKIALHFLERYPEYVEKVILASTTVYSEYQRELESWAEYAQRNTSEIKSIVSHAFQLAKIHGKEPSRTLALKTLTLDVYDIHKLPKIKKVIEQITFSGEWINTYRSRKLTQREIDAVALLNSINKLLLIIHGEKDMHFPMSVAKKLHDNVENSQLVILKNTGHLAHLESQNEWAYEVGSFLKSK